MRPHSVLHLLCAAFIIPVLALADTPQAMSPLEQLSLYLDGVEWLETIDAFSAEFNHGENDAALASAERALVLSRRCDPADSAPFATSLFNLAVINVEMDRFAVALPLHEQSLAIRRKLAPRGQHPQYLNSLRNLADLCMKTGAYARADKLLAEATAVSRRYAPVAGSYAFAQTKKMYGNFCREMGRYEEAETHFTNALAILGRLTPPGGHASYGGCQSDLGLLCITLGRYAEARRCFEISLRIDAVIEPRGHSKGYATSLNNMGGLLMTMGLINEAVPYYEKARDILQHFPPVRRHWNYSVALNNLGLCYDDLGKYEMAERMFTIALAIRRDLAPAGRHPSYGTVLNNLGALEYRRGNIANAIDWFTKSVNVYEGIRTGVNDRSKREYFATKFHIYQWLTLALFASGDAAGAFDMRELSSAKYLREKIAEKSGSVVKPFDIRAYCRTLDKNTAVIGYANSDRGELLILVATDRGVAGKKIDIGPPLRELFTAFRDHVDAAERDLARESLTPADAAATGDANKKSNIERAITLYRYFLKDPGRCRSEKNSASVSERVGRALARLLIDPVLDLLGTRTRLLILPDGALGFLPFEALVGPDGRYLAEKFEISYSFSLGLDTALARRTRTAGRRPFLGLGGAVYNADRYRSEMSIRGVLGRNELAALCDRGLTRDIYDRILWPNLPGTIDEVRGIQAALGGDVVTNMAANETGLKLMSRTGRLKKYSVIHFATHGLMVPDYPELSAIVLSTPFGETNGDDGYLQTKEILELDLDCDLVTLSACETGLGRIIKGEGIVGLTQSFLLAGTRGIAVSLWKIADRETMAFMIGVYRLVRDTGCGYRAALSTMKRRFLASEKYSSPGFWAPFVYYGN